MKRVLILTTLLILTACTAAVDSPTSSPSPAATATLTPSATVTPSATPSPSPTASPTAAPTTWIEYASDDPYKLSPDGKWLAQESIYGEDPPFQSFLKIMSTADPTHIIESIPIDGIQWVRGWSPDSTAVAVVRSTQVHAPCSHQSVIIYSFSDDQDELETHNFEPYPPGEDGDDAGHCLRFAWSPDSTQFAAGFIQNEFFIVDWKAQTVKKGNPEMQATSDISQFEWTPSGLFYVVREHGEVSGSLYYKLRRADLENPDDYEPIYQNIGFTFGGSNANGPGLLLVTHREGIWNQYRLLVLNTETGQIERRIDLDGLLCGIYDAQGVALTVVRVSEPGKYCNVPTNLWIMDWESDRYFLHGPVYDLLRWNTVEQGFSVVNKTAEGELEITIVPASELIGSDD